MDTSAEALLPCRYSAVIARVAPCWARHSTAKSGTCRCRSRAGTVPTACVRCCCAVHHICTSSDLALFFFFPQLQSKPHPSPRPTPPFINRRLLRLFILLFFLHSHSSVLLVPRPRRPSPANASKSHSLPAFAFSDKLHATYDTRRTSSFST